MKKEKRMVWDKTDLKVFILCLLNEMQHPMTYTAIVDTVTDCGCVEGFDFAECFSELRELGHVIADTLDGETYYMIADTGILVAKELSGSLPKELRARASVAAARHLELAKMGIVLHAKIEETEDGRYHVVCYVKDGDSEELMTLGLTVATKERAELVKEHCENTPAEKVYRAILSVATGEIGYFL